VTTLYVIERGGAAKRSTDQRAQIVALEDQLEDTKDELTDTKSELRKTQVDLTDAEEDLAKVEEGCPKAVQEFFDAAKQVALSGRSNSPEATAAANRMVVACGVSL
jgi:predicted  nucleic acid-binding Zn-ribbon protein